MVNVPSRYTSTDTWPAHLSVGAVLINDQQQVAFHHYHPEDFDLGEVYLLMRETLHDNETLEDGVARGLREEFGASGTILAYLDSLRCVLAETRVGNGRLMHKTTLYFLVQLTAIDAKLRDTTDREGRSEIAWLTIERALLLLQTQANRLPHWQDLDETTILRTAQEFLKQ